jgi:very-short-patch-repair endonuclease
MEYMEPIKFARYLRQSATSSEDLLWQLLRNRQRGGKKFRRQHSLGPYTADFYCVEAKLDIEVDGAPHDTVEGHHKDDARDAWMRSQGIEVLRFGGWQVENETGYVLETIDQTLLQRCPNPKQ